VPQGPTPSDADAIDRAVAATKGLYDSCHPGSHGEPVDGVLRPPIPGGVQPSPLLSPTVTAPDPDVTPLPFEATCWAVIEPGPGFVDVTLYFSSPQTGSTRPTSGPEGLPTLAPGRPTEVGRWEMLVLPGSAVTSVSNTSAGASPREGDVDYDFNSNAAKWELGGLSCMAGNFIGGTIHFFPPAGHHACRAHFKHV